MATTISSAQRSALSDNFFDNLGSGKDEFQPKNSLSALYQLAGGLVNDAQRNLNSADRVASGALSESMKILDPRITRGGKNISIDIELLYYYKFIDGGVKGTKGGAGKYAFKNDGVGKKMRNEIRKWIIREGLKHKSDKYSPITKREGKRKSITETSNQVAYVIARSIKQKGLKRTNFLAKAVKTARNNSRELLSKGFKVDIINALPKQLNQY